jgi:predicted RNA-binding protein with PUA-like domain
MKNYWLFKTEPGTYSIDDLLREKRTHWEGIRNYQARNFIRDDMQIGDEVLIYHSLVKPPAVVGRARIVSGAYPDFTARDKTSPYFNKKSTEDNPIWFMVDIEFTGKFSSPVTLDEIKADSELSKMMVAQRGMRLSIQPVEKKHFDIIMKIGNRTDES